jgi:hypothetical protein
MTSPMTPIQFDAVLLPRASCRQPSMPVLRLAYSPAVTSSHRRGFSFGAVAGSPSQTAGATTGQAHAGCFDFGLPQKAPGSVSANLTQAGSQ